MLTCVFPNCYGPTDRGNAFCDGHAEYRKIERNLLRLSEGPGCLVSGLTGVYALGSDRVGAVKIGIAADVFSRLSTIQTGFPVRLSLYGAFYTSRRFAQKLEAKCHQVLTDFDMHLNGEWFEVDKNDACDLIAKCAKDMEIPLFSCAQYYAMIELDELPACENADGVRKTFMRMRADLARELATSK